VYRSIRNKKTKSTEKQSRTRRAKGRKVTMTLEKKEIVMDSVMVMTPNLDMEGKKSKKKE
jgi:hypothetical protein